MPIYEYQCKECGQVFEEWQSGFEEKELECPVCGGAAPRIISNTSFVLKGSGWYVTDYSGRNPSIGKNGGNGGGNGDDNGNGNGNGDSAKSGDAKAGSESKTESKPPSKKKDAASTASGSPST